MEPRGASLIFIGVMKECHSMIVRKRATRYSAESLTALAKSRLSCESRVVLPAPVGPVKTTSSPPLNPLQILTSWQYSQINELC